VRRDFWSRHPMVERGKAPSRAQNVSVRGIASPSAHVGGGTARQLLAVLHDALGHVFVAKVGLGGLADEIVELRPGLRNPRSVCIARHRSGTRYKCGQKSGPRCKKHLIHYDARGCQPRDRIYSRGE
jgi:hypothetical protein